MQWPALKALFTKPERVQFARDRQIEHWRQLFGATYDEAYIASVKRIAIAHARIGLDPKYYICSYLIALEELQAHILRTANSARSPPPRLPAGRGDVAGGRPRHPVRPATRR
jgi:methyl-accepting chemotaxis protein